MGELILHYSVSDILIFLIMLSAAAKGFITGLDWAKDRIKLWVHKDEHIETLENKVNKKDNELETKLAQIIKKQEEDIKVLKEQDARLFQNINLLIESDKDDIKAWITREHHYFCNKIGKIDVYSLDCIERRYKHYVEEKGNSFIEDLMNEIKALPKVSASEVLKESKRIRTQIEKINEEEILKKHRCDECYLKQKEEN